MYHYKWTNVSFIEESGSMFLVRLQLCKQLVLLLLKHCLLCAVFAIFESINVRTFCFGIIFFFLSVCVGFRFLAQFMPCRPFVLRSA